MKLSALKTYLVTLSFCFFLMSGSAQNIVWQPLGQQQHGGKEFVTNASKTKIYKGTYSSGLYLSLDSGYSWRSIFPDSSHGVWGLAIRSDTLFAEFTQCYYGGIQYSSNDGQQWTRMDNGFIDTLELYGIAVNQTSLFAACYDYIIKTDDMGVTWQMYSTPHLPLGGAYSVCTDGNNIYVGSTSKVIISNDNGTTWHDAVIPGISSYIWAIYATQNRIFAGTNQGLYHSLNNGISWTLVGLAGKNVSSCKLFGSYGFAGTADNFGGVEIHYSTDSGSTWTRTDTANLSNERAVCDFTMLDNNVIAGGWDSGILFYDIYTGRIDFTQTESSSFQLFPNPASAKLTVSGNLNAIQSIEIFNIPGEKIFWKQFSVDRKEITMDVSDLNPGLYFVKVQTETGTTVQKFIKQ
jgi:photosystem II stability/assembly factor-like uncharacterized protein